MEHYSNFWTFEIASLPNVPGHYLRKYGILFLSNHICIIRVQNVGQFVVSSKEILFISGFIDCILLAKIISFLLEFF